jgi:hypothetical protein
MTNKHFLLFVLFVVNSLSHSIRSSFSF